MLTRLFAGLAGNARNSHMLHLTTTKRYFLFGQKPASDSELHSAQEWTKRLEQEIKEAQETLDQIRNERIKQDDQSPFYSLEQRIRNCERRNLVLQGKLNNTRAAIKLAVIHEGFKSADPTLASNIDKQVNSETLPTTFPSLPRRF